MNNKEHFETMTEGYMISFNKAMEMSHNPSFAAQVAMAVICAEAMTPKPSQQSRVDPFTLLMLAAAGAEKKENRQKRNDPPKKRNEPPEKRNADTENKEQKEGIHNEPGRK